MRIGTTPTHEFVLPFNVSTIADVELTYEQDGKIVLRKRMADCETSGDVVSFKFTEEDTFLFKTHPDVYVQMRVVTVGGDVLASDIFRISAQECLSDKILTGGTQ